MDNNFKFSDSIIVKMGFLLHPKFSFHLVILFILNMLTSVVIIGLTNAFNQPLVTYEIVAFILFVLITTLIEAIVKVFLLRHFISLLFRTLGILTLSIQMLIFMLGDFIVEKFVFASIWILTVFVFTILFFIVRLMLLIIYQKYVFKKLVKES